MFLLYLVRAHTRILTRSARSRSRSLFVAFHSLSLADHIRFCNLVATRLWISSGAWPNVAAAAAISVADSACKLATSCAWSRGFAGVRAPRIPLGLSRWIDAVTFACESTTTSLFVRDKYFRVSNDIYIRRQKEKNKEERGRITYRQE